LAELKWGKFEAIGFGGLDSGEKKLQFDLTESAGTVCLDLGSVVLLMFTYRLTVASGETNGAHLDEFLVHWIHSHRCATEHDATIQHTPRSSISPWPEKQTDITRKSKKTQKPLPPFGRDTGSMMGTEVIIEEAFMDVFCDLMYGGGWMEI